MDDFIDEAIESEEGAQMTRRFNELQQLRRALFAKLLGFHSSIQANAQNLQQAFEFRIGEEAKLERTLSILVFELHFRADPLTQSVLQILHMRIHRHPRLLRAG